MKASIEGDYIVFHLSFAENYKAKACGAKWHPTSRKWRVKPNKLTAVAVQRAFKPNEIDPAIAEIAGPERSIPALTLDPDSVLKHPLRPRQKAGVLKAWPYAGYALFWSMGAGKTISTIALINMRRAMGLIDRVLVVCPTSVKGVWQNEFENHSALETSIQVLEAGETVGVRNKERRLVQPEVLVVGVEAMSAGSGFDKAMGFVKGGRTMTIIDESSRIKNHSAGRTEKCWDLGEASEFRLILTGTSITQGIQDLFAQMYFLDPAIVGEMSYYSFRNRYLVMGGFESRKVVGYCNVDHLMEVVKPYCDVVKKSDIQGLPERSFQIRRVKATPLQIRASKELQRELKTTLGDKEIGVQNALEALLRFQQISGGFDPDGEAIEGKNSKIEEVLNILEDFDGKAVIWARYLPEIKAITKAVEAEWPGSTIPFTGAVPPAERRALVAQFQTDPEKRFFIANQQTGGIGLTLTAATLTIYYSNTFSLEERLQSEDRNHRIGSENPVLYIDLQSDLKVDAHVVGALAAKKDVADFVSDQLRVEDLA